MLENGDEEFSDNEHTNSTSPSKIEGITKCFDVEEVDDIIDSFDVSDATSENYDSTSDVGQENSECSFDQKLPIAQWTQNPVIKSRLSKNLKRSTNKGKQGRSQVPSKTSFISPFKNGNLLFSGVWSDCLTL